MKLTIAGATPKEEEVEIRLRPSAFNDGELIVDARNKTEGGVWYQLVRFLPEGKLVVNQFKYAEALGFRVVASA
jgi:hypothetical protein